jgi:hypothetical protein
MVWSGTAGAPAALMPMAILFPAGELTGDFSEQLKDAAHLSDTPERRIERA